MPCFSLKLSYDDFLKAKFKKSIVLRYDIVAADCMSFAATFFGSLSIVGVEAKTKKPVVSGQKLRHDFDSLSIIEG